MRSRIITSVLAVAALGVAPDLPAQVRVGALGGAVIATLGGADANTPGWRTGLHGSAFVELPISSFAAIRSGIGWVQKGIEDRIDSDLTGRIELSYVQIPLLARVTIPSEVGVAAHGLIGPVLSLKSGCQVVLESQQGQTTSVECDSPLLQGGVPITASDLGFLVGGGVTLAPRSRIGVILQVAYELGLSSIDDSGLGFNTKNRAVLFSTGVTISLGR
jgi:hypothetical protein